MMKIQTKDHTVNVSQKTVDYLGEDHDITLALVNGSRCTLRMTYEHYIVDEKVMSFYVESKHGKEYAHLNHLYVPESVRGFGVGRMCLAVFYALIKSRGIDRFSMKFGGGGDSVSFLKSMGFSGEYIETSRNTQAQGDSVVVGEYESLGNRYDHWTLDPISIKHFPTGFFN